MDFHHASSDKHTDKDHQSLSPSQTGGSSALSLPYKGAFLSGGSEPDFPRLKPHREGPCPNYMEMSPISISEGWGSEVIGGTVQ